MYMKLTENVDSLTSDFKTSELAKTEKGYESR